MYKKIFLKKDKTEPVLRFHPWIFSGAIAKEEGSPQSGDTVEVFDAKGKKLALGFYNESSIRVKIIAFSEPAFDSPENAFKFNFSNAFQLRAKLNLLNSEITNAYRLINAEGDNLPGLIIDNYNGHFVLQYHSEGMQRNESLIVEQLKDLYKDKVRGVYSKSARTLKAAEDRLIFGEMPERLIISENARKFIIDVICGQKTGFFLDQRDNRTLVGKLSAGRNVLNAFSYTGGFSVYAVAGGAAKVTSLDISENATKLATENVNLNNPDAEHEIVSEDFFEYLNQHQNKYDLIVLDPPSFAKHRDAIKQALRGYQTINAKAFKAIAGGGMLATFSCTNLVSRQQFESAVMAAAIESRRNVRILYRLSQAPCHVISSFHPEGEYLKGLILEVIDF